MYIAVYSAALIPPALKALGVNIYRNYVFLIVINIIGNIYLKGVISGKVVVHKAAV